MKNKKVKTYYSSNGSLCSGYGVFPSGEKCTGCSDCGGKFLKRDITNKEIEQVFNRTHAIITISKKDSGVDIMKKIGKKILKNKK